MSPTNMKSPPNYYKLLGVPSTATTHEITRAYHKKILEVHVDKCPNKNPNLCYETIEAYRVLSNHDARTNYDIQRDRLKGYLTDRELLERYKSYLEPGQPITPRVISNLRDKYNLEREDHLETFVPAGAITYDVEDQLSSIILKRIQAWEADFEEVKSNSLRDNYFECYSSLVNKVLRPDQATNQFWCEICDKNFLNESHHSEEILQPYLAYYRPEKQGLNVTSIYDFFHIQFGSLFTWEPPYLPKTLLGIWGRPEWAEFYVIQELVRDTSAQLLPPDFFEDVAEHVKYIRSCVPQPASEFICWVLENNEETHFNEMAKTLILSCDLRDILTFIAVLSEFLGFRNWECLCTQALDYGEIELTLFWTKVRELLGLGGPSDWLNLGMAIHSYKDDPYLSHFCFLLQGSTDWDQIASLFTADGDHLTAISYHLFSENPSASLQTYLKLSDSDPKGSQVYRNVYYSRKVKDLLMKLVQNRNLEDLVELITIIQILFPDPTEPFKLIINIYSEYFLEPAFNPIHRNSMDYFQSMPTTFGSLKLILGALHYLEPGDDRDADEYFLASNWSRMSRRELERSLKTSDFEKLTRCLLNMNRCSLPAAKEVLRELLENEGDLSSHVRGMMLLLRGSINKLEKNWLEATTDFQAALLNTPECLYRLTPCVSQLTQDIEYHEGVLARVQESLMDLKCNFEEGTYIEIDTSVHSLVVTDVVPQEEFGYKDLASRIQLEPPPLREENPDIQGEREQPPVETNTPLLTLDKVERAIEVGADTNNRPMDALSSALAYVDLLKALPVNLHHGPVVMAASHFLRAMNDTDNPRSMFAYRNAILEMAEKLLALDRQVGAKVQSSLTHKHMFSIALMANQRLSQCLATPDNEIVETKLISSEENELLEKLLKSVVGSSQVEPLANIPTLTCSDLSYVEKVKAHYLQAFCADKIQQKFQSSCIPPHVHAYALFLETWRGRCGSNNFERSRKVAMETFLEHHGCTMEDMRKLMERPVDDLDEFLIGYGAIDGFKIDLDSGEVSFLLSRGNLFTAKDMLEVFENSIKSASLSLEHPGLEFQSHPCKEVVYEPRMASTEYFKCLLRTSILLSTFATGVEICANPPFGSLLAYQSLFEPLPEHLQYFLRPLQERTCETALEQFRLWIQFCESYEETEESETEFIYKVGNVEPEVISENSTAADFAADFTRHYNEVEVYFPEFSKLKEFKKMSLIYSKLLEILNEKTDLMLRSGLGQDKNYQSAKKVCESITKLGIKLDEIEERSIHSNKSCIWVPSPSCHVEYADPYEVTGGVRIKGKPIYGPVSASHDSTYVPSQDLILELEYYREAIKGNQTPQYFTVTVDAGRAFEQQFLSNPSSQYVPNFDFEYGAIEGADLEAPTWTSPTAISYGSRPQILHMTKSHVSKQSSLPTLTEEESAELEAEQLEFNENLKSASVSEFESEFSSSDIDLENEDEGIVTQHTRTDPDSTDEEVKQIEVINGNGIGNSEIEEESESTRSSSTVQSDESFFELIEADFDHPDIPVIETDAVSVESETTAIIQLILAEIVAAISRDEEIAANLKSNAEDTVTPQCKNENSSEAEAGIPIEIVSRDIKPGSIPVEVKQEPITDGFQLEEIRKKADIFAPTTETHVQSEVDDADETESIANESEESEELSSEDEPELAAIESKPEKVAIQPSSEKMTQETDNSSDIESEFESESEYSENSSVSGIHDFNHILTKPIPCVLDETEFGEEDTNSDATESDISEFEESESDTDDYSGMHEIVTVHQAVVHVHSETSISHAKVQVAKETPTSSETEIQNISIPALSKDVTDTECSSSSSDSESELDSDEIDVNNQIISYSNQPVSDNLEPETLFNVTSEVKQNSLTECEAEEALAENEPQFTKNNDTELQSEDTSTDELESLQDSNSEFDDENDPVTSEDSIPSNLSMKTLAMDTSLPLKCIDPPQIVTLTSTNGINGVELRKSCSDTSSEELNSPSSDSEVELTDELNTNLQEVPNYESPPSKSSF